MKGETICFVRMKMSKFSYCYTFSWLIFVTFVFVGVSGKTYFSDVDKPPSFQEQQSIK